MDAKLLEYATSDSVYSKTDINTMKQVNKANLAIVSTDGTAPLDIAAGQYVYFDDVMYMATEAILTGARLVPNSNIVLNPIGVTNRIGDGLKNAVTQINGLADRMTLAEGELSSQSRQIGDLDDLDTTAKTDLVSATNELVENLNTLDATTRKIENVAIGETVADYNEFIFIGWLGWNRMQIKCANPSLPFIKNSKHTYTIEVRNNLAKIYSLIDGNSESIIGKINNYVIDSYGYINIYLSQASTLNNNILCAFVGDITIKRAS